MILNIMGVCGNVYGNVCGNVYEITKWYEIPQNDFVYVTAYSPTI